MNNRGQTTSWLWGVVVAGLGFVIMTGLYIIFKDVQQNTLHSVALAGGANAANLGIFEGFLYAFPIAMLLGFGIYVISSATQTRGY